MMHYRGAGGSGERGGGAAAGGGAAGGTSLSVDGLRHSTNIALRQLKKLRKYELEQVCKIPGLSVTGLKATLVARIEGYINNQFSLVARSGAGTALAQARVLTEVVQEVSRGYANVLHKRPVGGGGGYSQLKQDGDRGGSMGSPKAGGGGGGGGMAGGVRWDEEVRRDLLRRSELDPFVEVSRTLAGPAKLERGSGSQNLAVLRFNLDANDHAAVRLSLSLGKSTDEGRKTHMLLRSYKLISHSLEGAGAQTEAAKCSEGAHVWPLESVCQVNGGFQQLKQRKVFFQGQNRKLKGDCSPLDIGASCRPGENRVELYSSDPDEHAVLIQVVRLVGVEEVLKNVKQRSHLSKKEALRRVKRSFKGCLDLNSHLEGDSSEDEQIGKGAGGDDSDDDLMATATRLSLRCPLGLVPITCPGRGRYCRHLQCFDLNTFLSFNKDCAGAAWKCGVCNLPIKPEDLVVDTYLDEVVRSLEEQGLTDDAEEVEIHQDGHWDPILEDQKAGKMSRRDRKKAKDDAAGAGSGQNGGVVDGGECDTVDIDGDDVVTTGDNEAANGSATATAAAARVASPPPSAPDSAAAPAPAAAPAARSANEPEVFDLCSSDEDDELPAAPAPAPAAVGAPSSSAAAAAANFSSNGTNGTAAAAASGGSGGAGGERRYGYSSLVQPKDSSGSGRAPSPPARAAAAGRCGSNGDGSNVGNVEDCSPSSPSCSSSRYGGETARGSSCPASAQVSDAWARAGGGIADLSIGSSSSGGADGGRGVDWLSGGGAGAGGGRGRGGGQQHGECSAQQLSGGGGGGTPPTRLWDSGSSFGTVRSGGGGGSTAVAAAGTAVIPGEKTAGQTPQPWYPGSSPGSRQQRPPALHLGGGGGGLDSGGGAGGRARQGGYPRPIPSSSSSSSASSLYSAILPAPGAAAAAAGGGAPVRDANKPWKTGAAKDGGAGASAAAAPSAAPAAILGWEARAAAAAGAGPRGASSSSLKRPRPSSQSEDYPQPSPQVRATSSNRVVGGGGGGGGGGINGGLSIPFLGNFFGSSSRRTSGGSSETAGGGGGAGARWGDLIGGGGGSGGGRGGGGGSRSGAGATEAETVGGWDDEVFRNLDGLGDPLGR